MVGTQAIGAAPPPAPPVATSVHLAIGHTTPGSGHTQHHCPPPCVQLEPPSTLHLVVGTHGTHARQGHCAPTPWPPVWPCHMPPIWPWGRHPMAVTTSSTTREHPWGPTRANKHPLLWLHQPWWPHKPLVQLAPCAPQWPQASIWPWCTPTMAVTTSNTNREPPMGTNKGNQHTPLCLRLP